MQLHSPISNAGIDYGVRIVGETMLFPLDAELQSRMQWLHQRAFKKDKVAFSYHWMNDPEPDFREGARSVMGVIEKTLKPYIESLEQFDQPGCFCIDPAMMSFKRQRMNVEYRLVFRRDNNSKYLIAAPTFEVKVPKDTELYKALGPEFDPNIRYERILRHLFDGRPVAKDGKSVRLSPWSYSVDTNAVLVKDIDEICDELFAATYILERNTDKLHEAALVIGFISQCEESSATLEKRIGTRESLKLEKEKVVKDFWEKAESILTGITVEVPTLQRYWR